MSTHSKQNLVTPMLKRQALRCNGIRVDLAKTGEVERLQMTGRTHFLGYWIDRTGQLTYWRKKTHPNRG